MEEFEIVDELPRKGSGGKEYVDPKRLELANACKANPGKWIKVPTHFYAMLAEPKHFVTQLKDGKSPAFRPKGAFTGTIRNGVVYMMYNGEG